MQMEISTKAYESMVARRSYNYGEIEEALEIVKKFIIDNKRILYGGMALDLSARLTGEFIYDDKDAVLPDYDFYSPTPIDDAYELAQILFKRGHKTANAISALHITTMRVRLDNDTVADISYMPREIFKDLKTLKSDKFTIVHPLYQRMDQLKSLTEPMRDPPREPIFNRFKKDMTRFAMVDRLYPIEEEKDAKKPTPEPLLTKIILPKIDVLWTGYVSYAVHYIELSDMFDKSSKLKTSEEHLKKFKNIIPLQINESKKDWIIEIPNFSKKPDQIEQLAFWTDYFDKMINHVSQFQKTDKVERYNVYMDRIRPHMARVGKYDVFDNRGGLRPMAIYKGLSITTGQSTLLYFLHLYFTTTGEQQIWHLKMYQSCKWIIELTESILLHNFDDEAKNHIDKYSVFLSVDLFGHDNRSEVYEISKKYHDYTVNNTPHDERETLRPRSYYPNQKEKPPTIINIKDLKYYQINGGLLEKVPQN